MKKNNSCYDTTIGVGSIQIVCFGRVFKSKNDEQDQPCQNWSHDRWGWVGSIASREDRIHEVSQVGSWRTRSRLVSLGSEMTLVWLECREGGVELHRKQRSWQGFLNILVIQVPKSLRFITFNQGGKQRLICSLKT